MIRATSDSTAETTSAVATWSLETTASRRSRDSASAGNASSASNAIVRRRPWPSFWWRSPEPVAEACGRRWTWEDAALLDFFAGVGAFASVPFLAVLSLFAADSFFAAAVACMPS